VATLDFAECEEIYKIRERLEPLALSESIAHITDEQVKHAATLARELQAARHDPVGYLECDRRLHLACYVGVTTPRLLRMIVGFWNTTQQYRRILISTFDNDDYDVQDSEHRLIVDTLATRNARSGEDLMRAHIERSRLRLAQHQELFGG
jgi:DNA-binding GntR family transcriptional regulator